MAHRYPSVSQPGRSTCKHQNKRSTTGIDRTSTYNRIKRRPEKFVGISPALGPIPTVQLSNLLEGSHDGSRPGFSDTAIDEHGAMNEGFHFTAGFRGVLDQQEEARVARSHVDVENIDAQSHIVGSAISSQLGVRRLRSGRPLICMMVRLDSDRELNHTNGPDMTAGLSSVEPLEPSRSLTATDFLLLTQPV